MEKIGKRIGILGGGQLGRMMSLAASKLGISHKILDEGVDFPAASVCPEFYQGSFKDKQDVLDFATDCDVITIEIESINLEACFELQRKGIQVFPQPQVVEIIKDKGLQKQFYLENGIPTAPFKLIDGLEDLESKISHGEISFPFIQKLRKDGYDGKGVKTIKNASDLHQAFVAPSLVEEKVKIKKEIAIIAARSVSGELKCFPPVEMAFHPTEHLVEYLFAPADITDQQVKQATEITKNLVETLGIVGLLAVEFFIDETDQILVNEVAPRPHNSGHHTIEGNMVSQFEQHLRAIMDLPLGDTSPVHKAAIMINLLGDKDYHGKTTYLGIEQALELPGVYPHLYGKSQTKPYRKMGHVTLVGPNLQTLIDRAKKLQSTIKVISS